MAFIGNIGISAGIVLPIAPEANGTASAPAGIFPLSLCGQGELFPCAFVQTI